MRGDRAGFQKGINRAYLCGKKTARIRAEWEEREAVTVLLNDRLWKYGRESVCVNPRIINVKEGMLLYNKCLHSKNEKNGKRKILGRSILACLVLGRLRESSVIRDIEPNVGNREMEHVKKCNYHIEKRGE